MQVLFAVEIQVDLLRMMPGARERTHSADFSSEWGNKGQWQ